MGKRRKKTPRRGRHSRTLPEQQGQSRSDAPRQQDPGPAPEEESFESFVSAETEPDMEAIIPPAEQGDLFDATAPAPDQAVAEAQEPARPEPEGVEDGGPPVPEDGLGAEETLVLAAVEEGGTKEEGSPPPESGRREPPETALKPLPRDFGPATQAQLLASAPTVPVEYVALPGRRSIGRMLLSAALGALNLIATTLLVFGLVGAASYLVLKHYVGGTEVRVPALVELSLDEALEKLNTPGLFLRLERREYSESVPQGHVVAQFPLPGVTVKKGTPVRVVISDGAARVRAPSVVGMSEINAGVALRSVERADLDIAKRAEVYSTALKKGLVVAQDPPPSTPIPRDAGISLLISKGPPPIYYEMPDLHDKTLQEARIALGALRLAITEPIRETDRPGIRRGLVIAQQPRPGQRVARGDRIAVTIATGLGTPDGL